MELLKNTLYINLEHRVDRLVNIITQLKSLNVTGTRFNAIKMNKGHIGCTISHIKCLELAKKNEWDYVFICEDDIVFNDPKLLLNNLEQFNKNADIKWDVLIIGGNNVPPFDQVNNYCVKVYNCQTTTGYIVKKHYYDTLITNFKEGLEKLLRDSENKREFAIDIYWKQLQKKDNWYLLIPLTVTQLESYSDIEHRVIKYNNLMLDLNKEWLTAMRNKYNITN